MKSLFFLLLIFAFCAPVIADEKSNIYVYDSENDARAVVLNMNKLTFSIQGKNSIELEGVTEFSGNLELCNNEKYYCLSGPISIVVPKDFKFGRVSWFYHDVRCTVKSKISRATKKITCLRTGDVNETEIDYSWSRGVLDISKKSSKDKAIFKLRGYCGLFAKLSSSECHPP